MKKRQLLCPAFTMLLVLTLPFFSSGHPRIQQLTERQKLHSSHLFLENKGQIVDDHGVARPDVYFTMRGGGTSVFLTANSIHYQFERLEYPKGYESDFRGSSDGREHDALSKKIKRTTHHFTLSLKGANPAARVIREGQSAYTENYYLPQCPNGITGIRSYSRIIYKDVYPGIDWIVCSNANEDVPGPGMTYDFLVHSGADPSMIRLVVKDADGVAITDAGELMLKSRLGFVKENAPVSFCGKARIATAFVLKNGVIGFKLGEYDHSQDLRIDPSVVWATYYGGNGQEFFTRSAADSAGNVFCAGYANGSSTLAHNGYQTTYGGGNYDALLVAFDSLGNKLWSTYYGGSQPDYGFWCATDAFGNVYLSGHTYSNGMAFNGYKNSRSTQNLLDLDCYLVKFTASGIRVWGTYYGGTGGDAGGLCAVDNSGNVYLSGRTDSRTGIASGGFQNTYAGSIDAFLAKFSSVGAFLWGTYYGSTSADEIGYCEADKWGNVFLAMQTQSSSGLSSNGFQNVSGGAEDALLVKFNGSGTRLWATYYGGSGTESVGGCAADTTGNIYLCGSTNSAAGISSSGHQNLYGGAQAPPSFAIPSGDAFLTKFNSNTGSRIWGTYYGGANDDCASSCAVDKRNEVLLSGASTSVNNIAANGFQNSLNGLSDLFLARFDTLGARRWGTYFGGNNPTGDEYYSALAVSKRSIYLCGATRSSSGISKNGYQNNHGGNTDGFVVRIIDTLGIVTDSLVRLSLCTGDTLRVSFHSSGAFAPGNAFTAQLSDSSGTFNAPVAMGAIFSTNNIDTITAIVPLATIPGTRYRIRVVSSSPVVLGKDNRVDITIKSVPAQPGPISGSDSACTGSTQIYTIVPVPGAVSYIWNLPATWTGSSNTDTIVTIAGTSGGTISVKAVNACGSSVARTLAVYAGVNLLVTPTIQIPVSTSACSGKLKAFVATAKHAGSNPTFQWKKNGLNVGTNSIVYWDSALVTDDIIKVLLTSNAACTLQPYAYSNEDTVKVGVSTIPGININTIPPITLCQGKPITFVTNNTGGGPMPTYQWYKNGILLPGQTAPTYTDSALVNGDTLVISMHSSAVCPTTQPTFSNLVGLTVHPNLSTAVSIAANPTTIGNGPVTFTAIPSNSGPNPKYLWYLNSTPATGSDTTATWTTTGLKNGDVIAVRMESRAICPAPAIVWSAALPIQGGVVQVSGLQGLPGLKVYPNPAGEYIIIEGAEGANALLLNSLGQSAMHFSINTGMQLMDISALPAGVYLLRLLDKGGKRGTVRVVKQ